MAGTPSGVQQWRPNDELLACPQVDLNACAMTTFNSTFSAILPDFDITRFTYFVETTTVKSR